jgi:hypothetical protein
MTNEEILGPLPERLREAKEAAAAFDATGVPVNYRSRPRPDQTLSCSITCCPMTHWPR